MVSTIKFSEFTDGGDLANDDVTVGFGGGDNIFWNNPWVFLPPGSTGDRPVPAADNYYRLRLNTTLQVYEYYDPVPAIWVELSGSGTGTVNPGTTYDLAYYPFNGTTLSPINSAASSVLVTDSLMVPSLSTTLPANLTIPTPSITDGTYQVLTTVPNGVVANGFRMYGGTAGNAPIISALGSDPNIGITIAPVGNSPVIIYTAAPTTPFGIKSGTSNQHTASFIFANTATSVNYTFQDTNGTLAYLTDIPTVNPQALTRVNDTNVTLTLAGTPATALLQAVSMTLGWTGTLSGTRGGTGVNNGASTITLGGSLTTSGAFASTFTMTGITSVIFPTSGTLATTAGTVASVTGTANRITSTGGTTPVIDISASYVGQSSITTLGTIGTGVWQGTVIGSTYGGTGVNNGASTITLGGSLTTSGAFASTFTMTGVTGVTFPTSGTLATTGGTVASITGTANQVLVNGTSGSAQTGAVTLTTPQSLATTSSFQVNTLQLNGGGILDSSGNVLLSPVAIGSAVNYIAVYNAAAGGTTKFASTGASTDIGLNLAAKGAGQIGIISTSATPIIIVSGTGSQHTANLGFANAATTQTITYTDGNQTVTATAAALTNGQIPIGNTGNLPTAATLTAGAGVSITNAAGSITIAATGGGLAIATISGTTQTAAVNTKYFALNSGQTTLTLPAVYAVGDVVALIGATANTGGWIVATASGDTIRVNNATTSASGTVTSAAIAGQCIYLECDVANTSWIMTNTVSTTLTTS
jgi:hypothetical protein